MYITLGRLYICRCRSKNKRALLHRFTACCTANFRDVFQQLFLIPYTPNSWPILVYMIMNHRIPQDKRYSMFSQLLSTILAIFRLCKFVFLLFCNIHNTSIILALSRCKRQPFIYCVLMDSSAIPYKHQGILHKIKLSMTIDGTFHPCEVAGCLCWTSPTVKRIVIRDELSAIINDASTHGRKEPDSVSIPAKAKA